MVAEGVDATTISIAVSTSEAAVMANRGAPALAVDPHTELIKAGNDAPAIKPAGIGRFAAQHVTTPFVVAMHTVCCDDAP